MVVSCWVLVLTLGSGCAFVGGPGMVSPDELSGMKSGRTVEVTSVDATPPYSARDVTVSGEVQLVTGDTLYLADGTALPRGKIVAVHTAQPSFLHDVAMGALAGLAMHVAMNGLSTGMH
jgi:hypothetical protein